MLSRRALTVVGAPLIAAVIPGPDAIPVGAAVERGLPSTNGWVEARSANFVVYSDTGKSRVGKIAARLARVRLAVSQISKGLTPDDPTPTPVHAFRNRARFAPYNLDEHGRPSNFDGYFLATPFRSLIALDVSVSTQARP